MQSPGYTSLPGGWQQERRKSVVTWGAYQIPAVPLACSLLIITGLPMWAAGMLQARATTDSIFKDLGVAADSVDRLKAAVLTAVLLLSPLVAVVLGLNVWLEASRAARPGHTGLSLSHYTSSSTKVNAANWVLLLLLAVVALSGSITWLSTMSGALSATAGGGGGGPPGPPWWPPAAAAAAAAPPPPAAPVSSKPTPTQDLHVTAAPAPAAAAPAPPAKQHTHTLLAAAEGAAENQCPPGCVDLGVIAALFGLPGGCFCQTWLLADLNSKLQEAVRSLSIAVAGAALLLVGQSLLFGYLAGQAVHAARDLEDLLKQGDGMLVNGHHEQSTSDSRSLPYSVFAFNDWYKPRLLRVAFLDFRSSHLSFSIMSSFMDSNSCATSCQQSPQNSGCDELPGLDESMLFDDCEITSPCTHELGHHAGVHMHRVQRVWANLCELQAHSDGLH
uniref:Uncharacterized protein n=1 Tax=Tetradesmus obliquus TaxID=3088 RepID=A0A383VMH1_TETOB|eukprot:jgi/Sobl393_1/8154/SZX66123.1